MYGQLALVDDCIGNILSKLKENDQVNDTLIIFTSDHGDHFGQHGLYYKGPFPYDDGLKIPLIVRIPGKNKGTSSNSSISLADLAPTILSYAGIDIPKEMTGVDQKDVFEGEKESARDHIICEMRQTPTKVFMNTFLSGHHKIVFYYKESFGELFDLQSDPEEYANLWNDENSEILKHKLILEFISKKEPEFENYRKIWETYTLEQLLPVVWEYMLGMPDLMPRIASA
jgi:uncharacterized sulfatase